MTRNTCLIFLVIACLAGRTALAAEIARPNILYFYVDDMGWGSIGPNGQAERKAQGLPTVHTPNLDELARRGVNFTRGYGCHVCSPARSSQQTGFHQGHTFADRNDPDNAKKAIRAADVTMGDALSSAGYTTGYWGKWGYGGSKNQADPVIQNVQTLPTSHGYRHVLAELHHVRAHTFFQPTLWSAPAKLGTIGGLELIPNSLRPYQGNAAYPNSPAHQNHADYPATAYCDDSYAFAALDFVRQQGVRYNETGQPFFGLLAAQIPHAPFAEIAKMPLWDEAYAGDESMAALSDQTRTWAAMVTRIDAHFGNILAALDDPNGDGDTSDSITDNTLVVFQSDNGGPSGRNNVELDANGGLRGVKGSIHEGGIRVPLVMRWPAMIHETSALKAGKNSDRVVDVTDLLPTFCELAGAEVPLGIDGISIAPTLTGQGVQRHRDFLIHEAGDGHSIIRGRHKLIHKLASKKSVEGWELYDLQDDHAESNNLAASHPGLVDELKSLLSGERVDEPRGFANTYHEWTGSAGDALSNPDNWSDYEYSNAGVTYTTDAGPPQLSWVATIHNLGPSAGSARLDRDVGFLALQIGGAGKQAVQTLNIGRDLRLTGRNQIRLHNHSRLVLRGGTVSTLRWVDVSSTAKLQGHGTIDGSVFNAGTIRVAGDGSKQLHIAGDYRQEAGAVLSVPMGATDEVPLQITGNVQLAGTLRLAMTKTASTNPESDITIVRADQITGTFDVKDDTINTSDGRSFQIIYTPSEVKLTAK